MRQAKRLGRPKNHVPISYMKFKNDDGTISIYNYDKKAEKRFQLVGTITSEENESTLGEQSVQESIQTTNIAFQANSQDCQEINTQYFEPQSNYQYYNQEINGENFELQPVVPDDAPFVFNDDSNLCSNYGLYNAFEENTNEDQTQTIDYEQNENNDAFIELENSTYEMFDLGASSNFTPNIFDTNENDDISNFTLDDFDFSF